VLTQSLEYEPRSNPPASSQLRPDESALARAAEILAAAERPLLLVESGVTRCNALEEVVEFAELTGCRVYQGWMADVNFPVGHSQYLGDFDPGAGSAKKDLKETDVLVAVGCSVFADSFFDAEAPTLAGVKVVHIDDDPWEIGKNFPADCGLQGDIKVSLTELNASLHNAMTPAARETARRRAEDIGRQKAAALAESRAEWDKERDVKPIAVSRLMTEIAAVATPSTVVVDDCWSSSGTLRTILDLSRPGTYYRGRKGGSIGWGLPGALGVKLGAPGAEVIAVVGDGSAAWSMQSLWTAARYRIPVTYVVTNNATYGQVKLVRRIVLGDYPLGEKHEGMELDRPVMDFSLLAKALGVESERVTEPAELGPALRRAMATGSSPRLVEVMVRW
jgi:benzoylformate decarboxylase